MRPLASMWCGSLQEQRGDFEGREGGHPGEDDSIDGCDDGPLPAAAFVLDGNEGGYAREVEEDEHHVGKGAGRCYGLL